MEQWRYYVRSPCEIIFLAVIKMLQSFVLQHFLFLDAYLIDYHFDKLLCHSV